MFTQPVRSLLERRKLLTASPHTTVSRAAKTMASKQVSAVLVVEDEALVGIFTERDALCRVLARGLEPSEVALADVMTPAPKTIEPHKSFGHALLIMWENGFRHLPVVEHGKLLGVVCARDALDPDMEDFVSEERRRKHLVETR
jgi:CBS domain-containing protein